MKKVLLSLSMLAAIMTANAQSVGIGAFDDFNGPEYGTVSTAGIYWWTPSEPSSVTGFYKINRNVNSSGVMAVDVAKTTTASSADEEKFAPFGLGFGDSNGEVAGGTPFYIDMSSAKTISFKAKASTGTPSFYLQVSDANGINGEVMPASAGKAGDDAKYGVVALTNAFVTYTFDLTGIVGQTSPSASMWPCATYPTDCPDYSKTTAVDFTKITKVSFFVSGGATAYTGTVTLDDVKIGKVGVVGLGTQSAAANIASTKVYPNPSTGAFTAEVSLKNAASTTIILSDMMGKQISSKSVDNNGQANFETAGLSSGIYTVTYVVDGTPAKSELVVVK